jgi:dihydroorotate dehydrogenase electron transfer subunit
MNSLSSISENVSVGCEKAPYQRVRVIEHEIFAHRTRRIRIECPEIASRALPGQFVMLRIPDRNDPLLARPLAVYDTHSHLERDRTSSFSFDCLDLVYLIHGKFTTALEQIKVGDELITWGPLGNGFSLPDVDHLLLVAGGIGQTALLAFAKECLGVKRFGNPFRPATLSRRTTLCWGARTGSFFGGIEDFTSSGVDVHLATLDGSTGIQGTVIDLLNAIPPSLLDRTHIACCGPEPMMAAVGAWATHHSLTCDVSLEAPMACGVGICFTCVAKVRDSTGSWDYRRTCVEGPVFRASSIDWD